VGHAAKGYFTESRGNGRLYILRISDGKEKSGSLKFYIPATTVAGAVPAFTLTAKNPGIWAGERVSNTISISSKTGNTITVTFKGGTPNKGSFTGGYLQSPETGAPLYQVILHGDNGVLTLDKPYAGTIPSTVDLQIWKPSTSGSMQVMVQRSPQNSALFNLLVYYKSALVTVYENLSLDPASDRFAPDVINSDKNNDWFTISVQYPGVDFSVLSSPVQDFFVGTAVDTTAKTVTVSPTNLCSQAVGLEVGNPRGSEWVGSKLYIRTVATGAITGGWRISSVTRQIGAGGAISFTLTLEGDTTSLAINAGDVFVIEGPMSFGGGYDGEFALTANTLAAQAAAQLEVSTSPLRKLLKPEYGFLKLAIPGYGGDANAPALYAAAKALCEAYNWQWRPEAGLSDSYTTFKSNVENVYGRTDFAKAHFPCWMRIMDNNTMHTIPNIGDILGVEARIAVAYKGYYKAAAGIDATLSRSLGLVVGTDTDYELQSEDVELLNPAGFNCLVKKFGNVVIWGDRTLSSTSTWRWAHMREQMSHYEHVLLTALDWLNFAINNPQLWPLLYNYLEDYFYPQYKMGALMGKTFEDACGIVVDATNNNQQTIDNGEVCGSVTLQFPGTVEKVRIDIGRAAITEQSLV
jgi:hypothetical protein